MKEATLRFIRVVQARCPHCATEKTWPQDPPDGVPQVGEVLQCFGCLQRFVIGAETVA